MTKHYGLFYTEPTQSLIPHLELLNYNDNIETLKQVAEKFGLKHSNEKLLWDDLTYWSNEDFAYMILEVEIYDLKTVFVNYQNQIRYFKTIHDYDNYDEWEEIEITNELKSEKQKPKEIWICYYSDWYDERKFHGAYYELEAGKKDVGERNDKHLEKTEEWKDYETFSVCEYGGLKYELEKVEIK